MGQLTGVIQSIAPEKIQVLVSDASQEACSACALYETCMSSDKSKEQPQKDRSARVISIYDFPAGLGEGDSVTIEEAPGLQLKGAFYAFILPLAVLVGMAVWLSGQGTSDAVFVASLLGILVLHGTGLWLMRNRLKDVLYYKISSVTHNADRTCRENK